MHPLHRIQVPSLSVELRSHMPGVWGNQKKKKKKEKKEEGFMEDSFMFQVAQVSFRNSER